MKATDLMISDWVYNTHNRQNEQVAEIGSGLVMLAYNDLYEYDEIEPIPLTQEILKKNGFETDDDVHFSIQGQSDILELLLVEVPFDGYYFDIVRTEKTINKCNQRCYIDRYFASIDYVHQLQHALRLCGIEKEIIL